MSSIVLAEKKGDEDKQDKVGKKVLWQFQKKVIRFFCFF